MNIQLKTFKDFVGELKVIYKRTSLPLNYVCSSKDVIDYVRPLFDEVMDDFEVVKILFLNRNNGVIYCLDASIGGLKSTIVPITKILKYSIVLNASSCIMIHNHPSGNIKPSTADIRITEKLKKGLEMIDSNLLDSLIITRETYYSFADDGIL